ncbi:Monocarboxylate transporter 14 [Armadillidium nasatum]|uniref:Monocarboxylate transporter 14 n=1 Tax=Armadillidium nasatum TaxID=96803 RepID=A0A5N5SPU3_9CRUS|nr:Monocarboxylate transporter 14 [Armadillidium nasatum]
MDNINKSSTKNSHTLMEDTTHDNDGEEDALRPEISKFSTTLQLRDSGYAWLVLCAIFLNTVLIHGYLHSFGILSSAVMDYYPDSSGTMAGIIMGLLSFSRNVKESIDELRADILKLRQMVKIDLKQLNISPFVGTLANKIGIRKSMCFGAFLYATGLFVSFFCTSVIQLSVTLGVCIGLSQCIIESSQISLMSQYFVSKLSIANGVRGAASPFGGIIYPIVLTLLLEHFGLKLTFLLLGAINFHTLISAMMMRSMSIHLKIMALDKTYNIFRKVENQINSPESTRFQKRFSEKSGNYDLNPVSCDTVSRNFSKRDKEKLYFQILKQHESIKKEKPKKKLQFQFFKNPNYLLYILLAFILPMAVPLVTYYTILYTKNYLRMTAYEVTILVSFQSASDFFLRIFIGFINNKKICDKSVVLMICFWICAVGVLLIPLGDNLTFLMIAVGLYTFGPASYISSLTVILCEEFGKENITSTWGFVIL